ncbi:PriCT-2 domain-containing protein [Cupriavidus campinensis]
MPARARTGINGSNNSNPMSLHSGITTAQTGGMSQIGDIERYVSAMFALDPGMERESWVRVAMAAKASGIGLDDFDRWSSAADNYDAKDCAATWKSISADGRVGPGTLIQMAQEAGWRYIGSRVELTTEQIAKRDAERAQRREREERERVAQHEAAAAHATSIWYAAKPAAKSSDVTHEYQRVKGIASNGARTGDWPVIDPDTGEIRYTVKNALLLQIRDFDKRIHSVQAIIERTGEDGRTEFTKLFLPGGAKKGHFFPIGQPREGADGRRTFIVAEGFATAASVHEATGHGCVVAFDAGNLTPVCREIRARFPGTHILIVGDRDAEGHAQSTGSRKAADAALEVGACLFIPEWTGAGRDANDIFVRGFQHEWVDADGNRQTVDIAGPDHLQTCVELALAAGPLRSDQFNQMMEGFARVSALQMDDAGSVEDAVTAVERARDRVADELVEPARNGYFTILGHDHGTYFVFKHATGQVVEVTKSDMSEVGFIELAPLNWWEMNFAGDRPGTISKKKAQEFFFRTAERRGIYDPSRIRGRGAWIDGGRVVFHHGSHLTVDGERREVTEITSRYVYEKAKPLPEPHATGLGTAEGTALLDLLRQFRWSMPGSALLFGGWLALAPVCGALKWRPHVWLTGSAGSGKTTLANIASRLTKGTAVYAQGNSTEAGIRQRLKSDARPVVMDESESNEDGDIRRIQSILSLIRQASSESDAETLRGTADGKGMSFHIRSMFCLASIQVALKNKADIDRLTVLTLRSANESKDGDATWASLRNAMYSLIDRDQAISTRLLRRSIDLLPTTLKNIEVFSDVAAQRFGSQRDGDQYGTMLAGAWSLVSDDLATPEDAQALIDDYDWSEHRDAAEEDDSRRALNALLGSIVRMDSGATFTLSDLIAVETGHYDGEDQIKPRDARKRLGQFGLKVENIASRPYLFVSNENAERDGLMRNTPFKVGVKKLLMRLPGAMTGEKAVGKKTTRFPGMQGNSQGYFVVPIGAVFGRDEGDDEF